MTRANGVEGGGKIEESGAAPDPKRKRGRGAIRGALKSAAVIEVPQVASAGEQAAAQPPDDATHPEVFGFEWRPTGQGHPVLCTILYS